MDHLEFIDKIRDVIGILIQYKTVNISVPYGFSSTQITVRNLIVSSDDRRIDPLQKAIQWAIDNGTWKHSWHNEVKPENYAHLKEIVQAIIIENAENLSKLLAVYSALNYEHSKILSEKNH